MRAPRFLPPPASRLLAIFAISVIFAPAPAIARQGAGSATARGTVFHDRDGDRQRDPGEEGLPGVGVSNGRDIVETDAQGNYAIPVGDDTIVFVIKPSGWMTPISANNLPRFYYIHKPAGSPDSRFPGVAPTGPLPAAIDFPLRPREEPRRFEAIIFGDTQPRNQTEIDYIAHDVVEELTGYEGAAFGVTMGDIVFDNLDDMESLNRTIALIGIPWYNVIGNHDINRAAPEDRLSDETFERLYGPSYYSFDHGETHFIVLDDVQWLPANEQRARPGYTGGLGADQLEFVRNDLARIPTEQLVVLLMHVPLTSRWNEPERETLYRMMEARPLIFSISAHTHYQEHRFLTQRDGWRGAEPHHHLISVTVSGSWWSGEPDERGIPHTTMRGGAPNGYSFITFDGGGYSIRYKAAGYPDDYQMNIHAPEAVIAGRTGEARVSVNVFAGSERSVVEMRAGDGAPWTRMRKTREPDPYFAQLKRQEAARATLEGYRALPEIINSPHLWTATLPDGLAPGTHQIEVRTTDMFGQTYHASRVVRVLPRPARDRILIFSKTAGFRHGAIPAGIQAVTELAGAAGLQIDATEDAAIFTDGGLAPFAAVVFLNTTGDVLDDTQQAAFERYIRAEGGFVGVHAASDTEFDWPWYGSLVGAYFLSHPPIQEATVRIENPAHPSAAGLPAAWVRTDEWYNFRANPRGAVRVIATLDESTYSGGTMGGDHPIAWYHEFEGGRSWYTAGGHTNASYADPQFRSHLNGGLLWAAGLTESASATGWDNYNRP